jgi:hypothetical protein
MFGILENVSTRRCRRLNPDGAHEKQYYSDISDIVLLLTVILRTLVEIEKWAKK